MEASMLLISIAVPCAFAFVTAGILLINQVYRREVLVLSAQNAAPSIRSLAKFHIENGIECFVPLSRKLLNNAQIARFVKKAVGVLNLKGLKVTEQSLLSSSIAVLLLLYVVTLLLTRSFVAAGAVALCVLAATITGIGSVSDRLQNEFREEIPVVLELMTTCFGAGLTLLQTFQQIAHEVGGQLGKVFAQGAHVLETGGSVSSALDLLRKRSDITELTFVVAALEVQHQNGGALTSVLSTAAESIKNELALKRTLRVQTAQAKLSARVVIVMPFVLIAIFSLVSPNFMTPFFSSVAGYFLLAIAILMEAAGIVLVRRSLAIGGIS